MKPESSDGWQPSQNVGVKPEPSDDCRPSEYPELKSKSCGDYKPNDDGDDNGDGDGDDDGKVRPQPHIPTGMELGDDGSFPDTSTLSPPNTSSTHTSTYTPTNTPTHPNTPSSDPFFGTSQPINFRIGVRKGYWIQKYPPPTRLIVRVPIGPSIIDAVSKLDSAGSNKRAREPSEDQDEVNGQRHDYGSYKKRKPENEGVVVNGQQYQYGSFVAYLRAYAEDIKRDRVQDDGGCDANQEGG